LAANRTVSEKITGAVDASQRGFHVCMTSPLDLMASQSSPPQDPPAIRENQRFVGRPGSQHAGAIARDENLGS